MRENNETLELFHYLIVTEMYDWVPINLELRLLSTAVYEIWDIYIIKIARNYIVTLIFNRLFEDILNQDSRRKTLLCTFI